MITYIDIFNRLQDKKRQKDKQNAEIEYETLFKYTVPPFTPSVCSTAKGAKPKWLKKLSKILTFVNRLQFLPDECTIIPISTRSPANLAIWGNPNSITQAKLEMMKMGIISPESTDARFGFASIRSCYTFRYYRDNATQFIQFCEENYIEPFEVKNYRGDEIITIDELEDFDKSAVLFCSDLHLNKPRNMSENKFKDFLTSCLYDNYPQLAYYQKIVDGLNMTYYKGYDELSIGFRPSFDWDKDHKTIKSIGIRAHSSLNNIKKEKRYDELKKYGFDKEMDVKSSVPRLTLSLNNGSWFSKNVDLYGEIYKNCGCDDEYSDEMREAIKKLFMRAYFDSTNPKMIHHTWIDMDDRKGISKQEVGELMEQLKLAIKKTCGQIYGTYIFFVESCVYIRVLQKLFESGHKGWLLYDCFYCSGPADESKEQFRELVKQYLEDSFEEFIHFNDKVLS